MDNEYLNTGDFFNFNELSHLANNYAITCLKGYTGSFYEWYMYSLDSNWREIANKDNINNRNGK